MECLKKKNQREKKKKSALSGCGVFSAWRKTTYVKGKRELTCLCKVNIITKPQKRAEQNTTCAVRQEQEGDRACVAVVMIVPQIKRSDSYSQQTAKEAACVSSSLHSWKHGLLVGEIGGIFCNMLQLSDAILHLKKMQVLNYVSFYITFNLCHFPMACRHNTCHSMQYTKHGAKMWSCAHVHIPVFWIKHRGGHKQN